MVRTRKQRGFSLIELSVVLALIGLTAVIAAVYVSSGETELRKFVRGLRFDLERAKQEAASRNTSILVSTAPDGGPVDCNHDGTINGQDRCYIVYQDRDGNGLYTPGAAPPEEIRMETIAPAISFVDVEGAGQTWFSPLGGANVRAVRIQTAVPRDSDLCEERCALESYLFSVSVVGRISVGQKEESVVDCSYCASCGDCL